MAGNGRKKIEFQVEIIVEPDGAEYHAFCPALKGLHTSGATVKEALASAREAAAAYLESLIKHGDPIPVGVIVDNSASGASGRKPGIHSTRVFKEALTVAAA